MTKLSRQDFRPASEWIEKLPPQSRAKATAAAAANIEVARLAQVRKALTVTQDTVARRTGLKQAEVSRIENNVASVQLRTLDRYVSGLGGRLKIVAEFPDGTSADIPLAHGKPVKSKATVTGAAHRAGRQAAGRP